MNDATLQVILDEIRELRLRVEQICGEIGGLPEVRAVRENAEAYQAYLRQQASTEAQRNLS